MFGALFGWRKASKCKKLIKKVKWRLKLLRNKRTAIVKQLREDIGLLLRNGHEHVAFSRLGHLYMDKNLKEVYELLDSFCEFVLMKLSYIRKHKDCPDARPFRVSCLHRRDSATCRSYKSSASCSERGTARICHISS